MRSIKFSVLIPTRNRLELLAQAIETVLRQDYDDWEVIVYDNCSEEDIAGHVSSLNDSRIRYFRTERTVPVTENWNNAVGEMRGDYVVMLGDDDGLMPAYFSRSRTLIEQFGGPDLLYTNAYLFAYPGVMPECDSGFLKSYSNRSIFANQSEPFLLQRSVADDLVRDSLNFRVSFDYNMQFFLASSELIRQMRDYGEVFQSPYPDYYAANALLTIADKVVIDPMPMVIIGISPRSFGFFYFNSQEKSGNEFLMNFPDEAETASLENVLLPGPDMNTSWLLAMEALGRNFRLPVNRRRYRELQIRACIASLLERRPGSEDLWKEVRSRMDILEWIRFGIGYSLLAIFLPVRSRSLWSLRIMNAAESHPDHKMPTLEGHFASLINVFEYMDHDGSQVSTDDQVV